MHLIPIQDFCHKNVHIKRKKEIFDCKVLQLQRFSKFSKCWWKRPILEGALIQKPT